MNQGMRIFAFGAVIITSLAGCGGGSSSSSGGGGTPTTTAISGTAATGSPITGSMNAVVTLKDSSSPAKLVTTPTDSLGHYTFTNTQIAGLTAPFMLEVDYTVAGVHYFLHSAVTSQDVTSGSATINITPLTDLVIANLGHDIAVNIFKNGNYSSILTPTALSAGVNALDSQLVPLLTQLGVSASVDLLHQSFAANGTGLDGLLDILQVTVDPATRTATLINRTNNSTVTNDLTVSASSNTAQLTASTTPVSDLQAVTNDMTALAQKLRSGPSATDPTLLAFFDQNNFLDDGKNLSAFLQEVTSSPALFANAGFTNIVLDSVPTWVTLPAAASGGVAYRVYFVFQRAGMPSDLHEFIIYKSSSGTWFLLGNQRRAKAQVQAMETSNWVGSQALCTGLNLNVADKGGIGVSYAVVTGPGLPSAGVLLFKSGNTGGNSLQVAAGGVTTYNGTATAPYSSACGFTSLYALSDTAIQQIQAALPAAYTIKLYNDNNTPTNLADDILLATYPSVLRNAPLLSTQLTASMFASGVTSSPMTLVAAATQASVTSVTLAWHAPAASGMVASNVNFCVYNNSSSITKCGFGDVGPTDTSLYVAVPQVTGANGSNVTVEYNDSVFRQYWYSPQSGTGAF